MRKTWTMIEQDFFKALQSTELAATINGQVCKFGMRPKNSKQEDTVIKVSALDAKQLQSGTVSVITYIQPLDKSSDGWIVPDKERIAEIEALTNQLPEELMKLMPCYNGIKLFDGVGNYEERETEEFFVSVKIKFDYLTD
jgi:hypothetical protein